MKFLVRKTPDNFIRTVNDEISSLLNRHFDNYFPDANYWEDVDKLSMPIEVADKGKEFDIRAELPGVKKEDLDIDIVNDGTDITGVIYPVKVDDLSVLENKNYKHSEFSYGEYSRTIQLPQEIDIDKTEAKLEHGVLKIIAPKLLTEKEQSKKLIVK